MKAKQKRYLGYLAMGFTAAVVATFFMDKDENTITSSPRDYAAIKASGVIRAVTEYNSVSYYVEEDTISGFHYELMNRFARDHRLTPEITPEMSHHERLKGLNNGTYDVIAYSIPVTSQLKDSLLLTKPLLLSRQLLVQRKAAENDTSSYISSHLDLAHKTLYVEKNSPARLRITNLSNEIGDTIYIREVDKYGSEQLMAMVAHQDIDYAVCDEKIARALIDSFPQLDINTAISFTQFYSWGVSKQSPILLDSINNWLEGSFHPLQNY